VVEEDPVVVVVALKVVQALEEQQLLGKAPTEEVLLHQELVHHIQAVLEEAELELQVSQYQ
jgi:hypothetical protein